MDKSTVINRVRSSIINYRGHQEVKLESKKGLVLLLVHVTRSIRGVETDCHLFVVSNGNRHISSAFIKVENYNLHQVREDGSYITIPSAVQGATVMLNIGNLAPRE